MFDPWFETTYRGIRIYLAHLRGRSACTDGRHIWLDVRLTRVEARCSLTHELIHMILGHQCTQCAWIEARVRERAARLLAPISAILARAQSQEHPADIAEDLDITLAVLTDRMTTLTTTERSQLREATLPHLVA
ncbi:ImmA/IrrE family metallo-endopeptidase [Kocuria sp. TGY1127_2]|uniref:ImmA/IrrE family metallo-endopeptidase n=1 Tax=Kocuria sp. TGY1127_2 TaxID=2711328 RepID=UPI0015BB2FCA|nr:ImmA/IrrE family metallo-endopeptidase [Kocuria sp. TGY1127_2]